MPEAYNSIHTGEQIDQGISVILNNDIPGVVNEAKKFAEASKASSEASANSATDSADSASQSNTSATTSENFSKASESFAKGGTGTRPGEETDNAKYYSELAAGSAGGVVGALTFNGRSGNVMPEKGDYGPDQGNATLDDRGKIFKNQIPEEVLAANVPRSSGPPSDPDAQLYIDTSLANDDFYTAGEMDTKLNAYSTTEQVDTKISDAISALPTREPGSNQNLLINPWFQILQIPVVYNEIRDRWYCMPISCAEYIPSEGMKIRTATASSQEPSGFNGYICTVIFLPKQATFTDKLTLSARYTTLTGEKKIASFTFDKEIPYDSPVRSERFLHVSNDPRYRSWTQFQVVRKQPDFTDPNLSALEYDRYTVYFKLHSEPRNVQSIIVHNMKLEAGSSSTIAQEFPASYAQDLMECQRFRTTYRNNTLTGFLTSTTDGFIIFPLKSSMIRSPNLEGTFNDLICSSGKVITNGFFTSETSTPFTVTDNQAILPIKVKSPRTFDIGPCVAQNVNLDITTFTYPNLNEEYVFPNDPT